MAGSFAELLRQHRLRLRLTQEALAVLAAVSSRSIREMERGAGRSPRPDTTVQLADALQLSGADRAEFVRAGEILFWESRAGRPGRTERTVPRQLPTDVAHFTGRDRQLAQLDALRPDPPAGEPAAVVIATVSGTAGVGKTALVVHWAHRAAHWFPDGQLHLNLRGFDPGGPVMAPAEALRGLLHALDVPPERVPPDLAAQAALYRSLLAGRRMLIVLDNARDAGQVRPLVPASSASMVLVTSRNRLTGLVATDGAHALDLDVLSTTEAGELVSRRLGAHGVAAEPELVAQIVDRCARLPLALAVATARVQRTSFPLAALAAELDGTGRRLDTLDTGDGASQVRSVFSWSYAALAPPVARLFRLLGLHPGPDLSVAAAASLAGCEPREARAMLADLVHASLLIEGGPGRYAFHDLLREYAVELAEDDSAETRRLARLRLFDHYTHTAYRAECIRNPRRDPMPLPLPPLTAGSHPQDLAGERDATGWLTAERPGLPGLLRAAAGAGFHTHTWQLAWALETFLRWQGDWDDLVAAWRAALAAARATSDDAAAGHAHRSLAFAASKLGRHADAHSHLSQALAHFAAAGDQVGEARVHCTLAVVYERQDDLPRALDHAERALALSRAAGHRRAQAVALNSIGWCRVRLGRYAEALTACQEALVILQELGDRHKQAAAWDTLGYAYHHLRDHPHAVDCYRNAVALCRDLGDRANQADTLRHLGDTQAAAGDPGAARASWQEALAILTELGHPDAEAVRGDLATG
jgi:tetratricopeptide (TPR) repeat protein/transcriptional regulator with XRE-family HTH domain